MHHGNDDALVPMFSIEGRRQRRERAMTAGISMRRMAELILMQFILQLASQSVHFGIKICGTLRYSYGSALRCALISFRFNTNANIL